MRHLRVGRYHANMRRLPRTRLLVALLAIAAAGSITGAAEPPELGPAELARLGKGLAGGKVISGRTPHRILHFTFDDGPDPRTTMDLLERLDRAGVKATFFFSASRFASDQARNARAPEVAREVLRRGHAVGSHSVQHQRMARLGPGAVRAELEHSDRLFQEVFGARTYLFRPPFGSRNRALDRMLGERRYTTVMWNLGLADWVQRPPEALLQTFIKVQAREAREGSPGGVILMHDTHRWTLEALDLIVAHVRKRNCELLKSGEELFEIVNDLSDFVVPSGRPGAAPDAPAARISPSDLAARQRRAVAAARRYCGASEAIPKEGSPATGAPM